MAGSLVSVYSPKRIISKIWKKGWIQSEMQTWLMMTKAHGDFEEVERELW